MVYLKSFQFLDERQEDRVIYLEEKRTVFNSCYPFRVFDGREPGDLHFKDITVFYGGNGSGKTTLLNIMAQKLNAEQKQKRDRGVFFERYVGHCDFRLANSPETIKLITSDDVFDYLFDIRNINKNIEKARDEIFKEYLEHKFSGPVADYTDYANLKKTVDARKQTMSAYTRGRLSKNNIIEHSNGESALLFFEKEVQENSLYLLDEPENSLSAASQQKLQKFIEDSVRFCGCQFVISTHSPFLLSMPDAKIYDLDDALIETKKWTELENVRTYFEFFKKHKDEF